jgi:hypothetical protein
MGRLGKTLLKWWPLPKRRRKRNHWADVTAVVYDGGWTVLIERMGPTTAGESLHETH